MKGLGLPLSLVAALLLAGAASHDRTTFAGDAAMRAAIAEHAAIKGGVSAPALVQPLANQRGKLVIFAPRKDFFRAFENGASWADLEKQWKKGSAIVNMFAFGRRADPHHAGRHAGPPGARA